MHLICKPAVVTREGGDHTGLDAFMRCPVCRRRTATHVECERVTPEVERVLRREWRRETTTPPKA